MQILEPKSCNLLPQLGEIPNMSTKVGDGKWRKGPLSHFRGKHKIIKKHFFKKTKSYGNLMPR